MIDMEVSAEQEQIVDSIRSFLIDQLPYERFVPHPTPTPNEDRRKFAMLGELGVFGLGISEAGGGVGYTLVEELLVAREFGRFLVSPSVVATVIAAHVALASDDSELAAQLMQGTICVGAGLAFSPASRHFASEFHLLEADGADWVLLWAEGGLALVRCDQTMRRDVASIDSSITLSRIVATELMPHRRVDRSSGLCRRAQLLVGAYLTGLAEGALSDSIDYVRVREQFEQPIGAFQAVKHRCADMLARASVAWNQTIFAALMEMADRPDAEFQAIAAKLLASDAAFRNGAVNIQNHGAYGFTGEHHAHLFVKRAHLLDRFGGDATYQKHRMLAATPPFDT